MGRRQTSDVDNGSLDIEYYPGENKSTVTLIRLSKEAISMLVNLQGLEGNFKQKFLPSGWKNIKQIHLIGMEQAAVMSVMKQLPPDLESLRLTNLPSDSLGYIYRKLAKSLVGDNQKLPEVICDCEKQTEAFKKLHQLVEKRSQQPAEPPKRRQSLVHWESSRLFQQKQQAELDVKDHDPIVSSHTASP